MIAVKKLPNSDADTEKEKLGLTGKETINAKGVNW